jgi:hypothetical protein
VIPVSWLVGTLISGVVDDDDGGGAAGDDDPQDIG